MQVNNILAQVDFGSMALPEFQRGYVWNREQVRALMDSLYRRYPVGSLLVWVTQTENAAARGDGKLNPGIVQLLLDGQQRITSLYGIIRGQPPQFFEGNAQSFTGLYFNLEDESFEFHAPMKMRDNPRWISVTELMQRGAGVYIDRFFNDPVLRADAQTYLERLNMVETIKNIDLHIEQVAGHDKTVDIVVEIFNKVNSGGTKLSKGDLALAKICAEWPDARGEMKERLQKWRDAGFNFKLEWLLRCVNTVTTGEALFSALSDVTPAEVDSGLMKAEHGVDTLLNLISSRLGLDHDRVLGSRYSFPLMVRYLDQRGGRPKDYVERDRLLYWYIHTFLWGRYAGSTETVLNQDLALIESSDQAIEKLIGQLRQNRGDLRIQPSDFRGWGVGARFYPLLYMLTRVYHSRDWESGIELRHALLGRLTSLQLHHIFPKALLYKHDYSRADVNALANFTFLTQGTNLRISNRPPEEYLEEIEAAQPGVLESHWIPMDRELWRLERFLEFLEARRELLADAANEFLDGLLLGSSTVQELDDREAIVSTEVAAEEEEILLDLMEWLSARGLPEGELSYELTESDTNVLVAVFDIAWPEGLQEGFSQPAALLLEHDVEAENHANNVGFRYFHDVGEFKRYVERDILAVDSETAAD